MTKFVNVYKIDLYHCGKVCVCVRLCVRASSGVGMCCAECVFLLVMVSVSIWCFFL